MSKIPMQQRFMSRSMTSLVNQRINAVATSILNESQIETDEALELARQELTIASALLKLNETAKYKTYIRNVTTRNNGMISFLPAGQDCIINDDGKWSRQNRVDCKPGKFLTKIMRERNYDWSNSDIEKFVNFYKSKTVIKGEFSVVSGDEIADWYHHRYYADGCGSLNESCMKHGSCQDYFGIYTDNDNVAMIVLVNDESHLVGRALLWDGKYMDRVYGSDDTIVAFHNFAEEKGYINIYKSSIDAVVRLKYTRFDHYPYMDTMYNVYDEGVAKDGTHTLGSLLGEAQSTDGGLYTESDYANCCRCGDGVDEGDYYYINDEYYCRGCVIHSNIQGDYIPRHLSQRLYTNEYCYSDDAVRLFNGEYAYHDDDNIVDVGNNYFHIDDCKWCDYEEDWFVRDDHTWFKIRGIDIADVSLDGYLEHEYGFKLKEYGTSVDHVTNEEVELIIYKRDNNISFELTDNHEQGNLFETGVTI